MGTEVGLGGGWEGGQGVQAVETLLGADISSTAATGPGGVVGPGVGAEVVLGVGWGLGNGFKMGRMQAQSVAIGG